MTLSVCSKNWFSFVFWGIQFSIRSTNQFSPHSSSTILLILCWVHGHQTNQPCMVLIAEQFICSCYNWDEKVQLQNRTFVSKVAHVLNLYQLEQQVQGFRHCQNKNLDPHLLTQRSPEFRLFVWMWRKASATYGYQPPTIKLGIPSDEHLWDSSAFLLFAAPKDKWKLSDI